MDWWDDIKTILTVVVLGIPLLSKLVKALISKPVAAETVQKPLVSESSVEEYMPEESNEDLPEVFVENPVEPESKVIFTTPQQVAQTEMNAATFREGISEMSKLDCSQFKVVSGAADLKKLVIYSEIMTPKYK